MDHLLDQRSDAEFVGVVSGPARTNYWVARFEVTGVSENEEKVDYSVEISENLLREAIESLTKQKDACGAPTPDSDKTKDSPTDNSLDDFL